MTLPATRYWFTFSGRRNRKSYIQAILLLVAIEIFAISLLYILDPTTKHDYSDHYHWRDFFSFADIYSTVIVIAFLLIVLFSAFAGVTLTVQRLHDMNLNGWFVLMWIPITMIDARVFSGAAYITAFIMLCVIPGSREANRYGMILLLGQGHFHSLDGRKQAVFVVRR